MYKWPKEISELIEELEVECDSRYTEKQKRFMIEALKETYKVWHPDDDC